MNSPTNSFFFVINYVKSVYKKEDKNGIDITYKNKPNLTLLKKMCGLLKKAVG